MFKVDFSELDIEDVFEDSSQSKMNMFSCTSKDNNLTTHLSVFDNSVSNQNYEISQLFVGSTKSLKADKNNISNLIPTSNKFSQKLHENLPKTPFNVLKNSTFSQSVQEFSTIFKEDEFNNNLSFYDDYKNGNNTETSFSSSMINDNHCFNAEEMISNIPKTSDFDIFKNISNEFNSENLFENQRNKRKFPGPAGLLPNLVKGQFADDKPITYQPSQLTIKPSSQSQKQGANTPNITFKSKLWQAMLTDLNSLAQPALFPWMNDFQIASIYRSVKHKRLPQGKVPLLCGMVVKICMQGLDATLTIKDSSGSIQGAVHREVVRRHADKIHIGSVLILKHVGVFSPLHARSCYLNITNNNILHVYSHPIIIGAIDHDINSGMKLFEDMSKGRSKEYSYGDGVIVTKTQNINSIVTMLRDFSNFNPSLKRGNDQKNNDNRKSNSNQLLQGDRYMEGVFEEWVFNDDFEEDILKASHLANQSHSKIKVAKVNYSDNVDKKEENSLVPSTTNGVYCIGENTNLNQQPDKSANQLSLLMDDDEDDELINCSILNNFDNSEIGTQLSINNVDDKNDLIKSSTQVVEKTKSEVVNNLKDAMPERESTEETSAVSTKDQLARKVEDSCVTLMKNDNYGNINNNVNNTNYNKNINNNTTSDTGNSNNVYNENNSNNKGNVGNTNDSDFQLSQNKLRKRKFSFPLKQTTNHSLSNAPHTLIPPKNICLENKDAPVKGCEATKTSFKFKRRPLSQISQAHCTPSVHKTNLDNKFPTETSSLLDLITPATPQNTPTICNSYQKSKNFVAQPSTSDKNPPKGPLAPLYKNKSFKASALFSESDFQFDDF